MMKSGPKLMKPGPLPPARAGEPQTSSTTHGVSGYCLTMWVIPTAAVTAAGGNPAVAADPASFRRDSSYLPTKALHPSAIAIITNEGGKKVTQPLYSHPCTDPRATRLVHDGVTVRWTVPALAGGLVCIPDTPELAPLVRPRSLAWRAGGADGPYLASSPPHATIPWERARTPATGPRPPGGRPTKNFLDALATTLNEAWGPRKLGGWCEQFALRFAAPGALAEEAAAAQLTGPVAHAKKLLNTRPPPLSSCSWHASMRAAPRAFVAT